MIVLIETQRSMTDICEIDLSNGSKPTDPVTSEAHLATLGYLPFAVKPAHSVATDKAAESRCLRDLRSQGRRGYDMDGVILDAKESR